MRDPPLHEKVAFLALGLRAGESSHSVKVQLAGTYMDRHRGTDVFLVKGNGRLLWVDLTEGHRRTLVKKFQRNIKFKRSGGYRVWILPVRREDVIGIGADPCFSQAWSRLATYKPVAFSPQDICPEDGDACPLVEKLSVLGRDLVMRLRKDYQALFD